MRKIFIILLLIGSTSAFAQTYFPFPDSIGVWRQASTYDQGLSMYELTNYNIFLNGDTIIDSTLYSKLYIYSCGTFMIPFSYPNPPTGCPIDTSNASYYGLLREINKKVYFRPDSLYYNNDNSWSSFCFASNWNRNEDLLLYDFNVNEGDTIVYPFLDSLSIFITSIDSILIQTNYRKKFNYNISSWGNSSSCSHFGVGYNYVEGIGDISTGLFSLYISYFENAESLNCFEDDEVSFSNVSNCMTLGTDDVMIKDSNQIYPNPASEVLFIEIDNPTTNLIYILDITGKEIYTTKALQRTTTIDVSYLKSGLYMVKIVSNQGNITSKLISIY